MGECLADFPALFLVETIIGGRQTMIESPVIQELVAEKMQGQILRFLTARFGSVPQEIATTCAGGIPTGATHRLGGHLPRLGRLSFPARARTSEVSLTPVPVRN
jgi:hypothetical protein